MKKYSIKNKIPYCEIPEIHSPRASFPCYLYSILNVLEDVIPVKKQDVKESISLLRKTRKEISGTMIGAYETTFGIGWAIGPISAGLISQFFGNDAPYFAFFALGIGVTVLSIAKRKMLEPNRNPNI